LWLGARQQFVQIERGIFRAVFDAESDFGIAESGLRGGAIGSSKTTTQNIFDFLAQFGARAVQMTRNAGLMFFEQAADFGEGFFFGVVIAEALSFLGR
jgi:hypothetical protein